MMDRFPKASIARLTLSSGALLLWICLGQSTVALADKVEVDQKEVLTNRPDSNLETIQSFTPTNRYRKLGGAVGRLVVRFDAGGAIGYCTATLITTSLILTASHCLKDPDSSDNTVNSITLYLEDVDASDSARGTPFTVDRKPVEFDSVLDYAILEAPDHPGQQAQFAPLGLDIRPLVPHEELFIVHHPEAHAQHLTRRACRVRGINDASTVLHTCDTTKGSSGAALMSDNAAKARILAIHTRWKTLGPEKLNVATTMSAIVQKSCVAQKLSAQLDPAACPRSTAVVNEFPKQFDTSVRSASAPVARQKLMAGGTE